MAITTHNLYFYLELMREARAAILEQRFDSFASDFRRQRSAANDG